MFFAAQATPSTDSIHKPVSSNNMAGIRAMLFCFLSGKSTRPAGFDADNPRRRGQNFHLHFRLVLPSNSFTSGWIVRRIKHAENSPDTSIRRADALRLFLRSSGGCGHG
jgi:hypothetical protein